MLFALGGAQALGPRCLLGHDRRDVLVVHGPTRNVVKLPIQTDSQGIQAIAASSTSGRIAVAGGSAISIYTCDASTKDLAQCPTPSDFHASYVIKLGANSTDASSRKQHGSLSVEALALSADGSLLAAVLSGATRRVQVWSLRSSVASTGTTTTKADAVIASCIGTAADIPQLASGRPGVAFSGDSNSLLLWDERSIRFVHVDIHGESSGGSGSGPGEECELTVVAPRPQLDLGGTRITGCAFVGSAALSAVDGSTASCSSSAVAAAVVATSDGLLTLIDPRTGQLVARAALPPADSDAEAECCDTRHCTALVGLSNDQPLLGCSDGSVLTAACAVAADGTLAGFSESLSLGSSGGAGVAITSLQQIDGTTTMAGGDRILMGRSDGTYSSVALPLHLQLSSGGEDTAAQGRGDVTEHGASGGGSPHEDEEDEGSSRISTDWSVAFLPPSLVGSVAVACPPASAVVGTVTAHAHGLLCLWSSDVAANGSSHSRTGPTAASDDSGSGGNSSRLMKRLCTLPLPLAPPMSSVRVTSLSAHPSLPMVSVGCSDGSVLLAAVAPATGDKEAAASDTYDVASASSGSGGGSGGLRLRLVYAERLLSAPVVALAFSGASPFSSVAGYSEGGSSSRGAAGLLASISTSGDDDEEEGSGSISGERLAVICDVFRMMQQQQKQHRDPAAAIDASATAAVGFARLPSGGGNAMTCAAWAWDGTTGGDVSGSADVSGATGTPTLFLGSGTSGHIVSLAVDTDALSRYSVSVSSSRGGAGSRGGAEDWTGLLRLRARMHSGVRALAAGPAVSTPLLSSQPLDCSPRGDGLLAVALAGEKPLALISYDPFHTACDPIPTKAPSTFTAKVTVGNGSAAALSLAHDTDVSVYNAIPGGTSSIVSLLHGPEAPLTSVSLLTLRIAPPGGIATAVEDGQAPSSSMTLHLTAGTTLGALHSWAAEVAIMHAPDDNTAPDISVTVVKEAVRKAERDGCGRGLPISGVSSLLIPASAAAGAASAAYIVTQATYDGGSAAVELKPADAPTDALLLSGESSSTGAGWLAQQLQQLTSAGEDLTDRLHRLTTQRPLLQRLRDASEPLPVSDGRTRADVISRTRVLSPEALARELASLQSQVQALAEVNASAPHAQRLSAHELTVDVAGAAAAEAEASKRAADAAAAHAQAVSELDTQLAALKALTIDSAEAPLVEVRGLVKQLSVPNFPLLTASAAETSALEAAIAARKADADCPAQGGGTVALAAVRTEDDATGITAAAEFGASVASLVPPSTSFLFGEGTLSFSLDPVAALQASWSASASNESSATSSSKSSGVAGGGRPGTAGSSRSSGTIGQPNVAASVAPPASAAGSTVLGSRAPSVAPGAGTRASAAAFVGGRAPSTVSDSSTSTSSLPRSPTLVGPGGTTAATDLGSAAFSRSPTQASSSRPPSNAATTLRSPSSASIASAASSGGLGRDSRTVAAAAEAETEAVRAAEEGWVSKGNELLGLLYPPSLVTKPGQKRTQAVLMQQLCRLMKRRFNARHEGLRQVKLALLRTIHERNTAVASTLRSLAEIDGSSISSAGGRTAVSSASAGTTSGRSRIVHVSPLSDVGDTPSAAAGAFAFLSTRLASSAASSSSAPSLPASTVCSGPVTVGGVTYVIDPTLTSEEVPEALTAMATSTADDAAASGATADDASGGVGSLATTKPSAAAATGGDEGLVRPGSSAARGLRHMLGSRGLQPKDDLQLLTEGLAALRQPWMDSFLAPSPASSSAGTGASSAASTSVAGADAAADDAVLTSEQKSALAAYLAQAVLVAEARAQRRNRLMSEL